MGLIGIRAGEPAGGIVIPQGPWQPPTGPVENIGPETNIVVWTLIATSGLLLLLRIYCKKFIKSNGLWWDDWVLIASWLCFIGDGAMAQAVVGLGFGKHVKDVDPRNFPLIGLRGNIGQTFGILAVVWSKTSFAITLLRLTKGRMRTFIWGTIVTMNIFMGLLALFTWVQCTPIQRSWNKKIEGTCWENRAVNAYGVFSGCFSGLMDILLAMLPWQVIWGLQMQKKEKLGVAIAMSMGVFAGATAFVKSHKILKLGGQDFTFEVCDLLVWSAAEISTTIMAACIPILRVFVRDAKRSYGSGSHSYDASKIRANYTNNTANICGGTFELKPGTGRFHGGNSVIVTADKRRSLRVRGPLPPPKDVDIEIRMMKDQKDLDDDSSDRSTLPIQGSSNVYHAGLEMERGIGIVQTQEVAVEYGSRRGSDESLSYEMAGVAR